MQDNKIVNLQTNSDLPFKLLDISLQIYSVHDPVSLLLQYKLLNVQVNFVLTFREKEELEQTEAKLTCMLIRQDKNGYLASDSDFLRRLSTTLCSKGLPNISCLETRQAVIGLFVHLLKDMSHAHPNYQVNKPSLNTLTSHAMNIVGTERCSEVS